MSIITAVCAAAVIVVVAYPLFQTNEGQAGRPRPGRAVPPAGDDKGDSESTATPALDFSSFDFPNGMPDLPSNFWLDGKHLIRSAIPLDITELFEAYKNDQVEEYDKADLESTQWDSDPSVYQNITINSEFECFEEEAICTVLKHLGSGTFGDVFKVKAVFKKTGDGTDEDERLLLSREEFLKKAIDDSSSDGVVVAVKILKNLDPTRLRQNLKEAFVWVELSHPSITDLYHVEINRGKLFLYTEYIEGSDLKEIIGDSLLYSSGNSIQNLVLGSYQIVAGIQHTHDNKVHHFDIKPANIMVKNWKDSDNIEFKIMDWGIAQSGVELKSLSEKQVCGGSPYYMAPEFRDKSGDILCKKCNTMDVHNDKSGCCSSVDNWALAATLINIWLGEDDFYYSIYKGKVFTKDAFKRALVSNHKKDHPSIPDDIQEALYDLLHPKIKNRPCSLKNMLESIEKSAVKLKINLAPIKTDMVSKTLQFEKLILEGLSILELSYALVDQQTITETLTSAKNTFLQVVKSSSPYVYIAHLNLATVYFLLAMIYMGNSPPLSNDLSLQSFNSLSRSVAHFSVYLDLSKNLESITVESNEAYYNFLCALKYLGASKHLDENEFSEFKVLHEKLMKSAVFFDDFDYNINHYKDSFHLGAMVQLTKSSPFSCLVNHEVGSIIRVSASHDRFKVATPRFESCWIPSKYLATVSSQPSVLSKNDIVFRRDQKDSEEVCGLKGGETGTIVEIRSSKPSQPYKVLNVRDKEYWCSPSLIMLASVPLNKNEL